MTKETIRNITVTGICTNCGNRKSCTFIKDIEPFIRNRESVRDCEISIYSCENYEAEIEQICDESEMCISCHQEE